MWIIFLNGNFAHSISTKMGLVVGISGVSRAGKSTLSKRLTNRLHDWKIIILDMDDFVFPKNEMPRINEEADWETPESVDYVRLSDRINEVNAGFDLVIVEWILIFYDETLNSLFDKKLFIEIPYETFLERKRNDRRWNEPEWYIQHIWDSYLKYGLKNSEDAMKISGNSSFEIPDILEFIRST